MPRTLILHIGLEKTGTTSFQHFCSDHAGLLARHGILYPKRNKAFGIRNHANLAACYVAAREPDFTMSGSRASRASVVGSLLADVARHPAPTVLVSSEHLSSRFDPPDARCLAEDFREFAIRVLVVVREHRARFFSSYATHVLSGGVLSLHDYAAAMLAPGKRDHRVAQMLATWEEGFGRPAVDLVDYDAQGDIVPALLGRYGLDPAVIRPLPRYRDLTSLPPSSIEVIRQASLLLAARQSPRIRQSYAGFLQRSYFRTRIARQLAVLPRRKDEAWRLDPALLLRLDDLAGQERAWLARHYGIAMRAPGGGRITAPAEAEADGRAARTADALVAAVTRGRWGVSVALATAARRLRP